MPSEKRVSGFKKVQSFKTDYAPCTITQYVSQRSGMQVVVADRQGPKVNGYFTLATEIFDDSGAPHTLEHLIFLGSKSYPYKGLLDKLSARAYSGTNAWTAIDHTAYTLETAGWEGFSQILPLYLEHVLLPTLTDEGVVTEVWHIDGQGNDAGVVYSEMQSSETSGPEIMKLKACRLLYTENIGFRYETGGMPKALRVLTADRIRQFHKEMYQPRNLCVVIVGETNHDDLLQKMDDFEESIAAYIPDMNKPFKRPWVDSEQPQPLAETIVTTAEFPDDDESTGEILVGFFGPSCTDLVATSALNIVLSYLCDSSVAVLENTLVEKEQLASSVTQWWDSRPNSVIWLQPTGVATEKLAAVEKRLFQVLKDVVSKPLDMDYMSECISREQRQVKFFAETSESFYSTKIISDYLFGSRNGTTLREMESLQGYTILEKWNDNDWRDFIRKWFLDAHHISVLGKPSIALAEKMKKDEAERIAKRKEEIGKEGLEKLAKKLADAQKKNDEPIPPQILDQFKVPGTESIHFIESDTARYGKAKALGPGTGAAQRLIDAAPQSKLPLFIQFEGVPTNFVHITVHIGTSEVPVELKPFMPIFTDNFFNTHIMRDGKQVNFEQVVMDLERDSVGYDLRSGRMLGDPDTLVIQFQVEPEKYAAAIDWIRTMMFDSVFDPQRLKAAVTKALADIPEAKRNGQGMALEIDAITHFDNSTLTLAKRILARAAHLRRLKRLLKSDPEQVISWFNQLRRSLFTFKNLRILVAARILTLPEPVKSWDRLADALGSEQEMLPLPKLTSMLNDEGRKPGSVGATIVPMASLDSSFSVSTATGLFSYSDPRLPAVMVAVGYLEAVQGPLWVAVRGGGFAYGSRFSRTVDSGLLYYWVHNSPDAGKAIAASKEAIRKIADGEEPIDKHLLEGTVSQVVVIFADEQSTMPSAAQQNFLQSVVRGLPKDWNKDILRRIRAVTEDEIRAAMKDVILPCFNPGESNVSITCAKGQVENLEASIKALGYKVQVRQLKDFEVQDDEDQKNCDKGDNDNDDEDEEDEDEDEDDEEDESGDDE